MGIEAIRKGEVCVCLLLADQDMQNLNTAIQNYNIFKKGKIQEVPQLKKQNGFPVRPMNPNNPLEDVDISERNGWFGNLNFSADPKANGQQTPANESFEFEIENPVQLLDEFINQIKKLCFDVERVGNR